MIWRTLAPYALAAILAFGMGWTVNGWRLGTIVAQSRTEAAQINAIVARNEADLERSRADENAKAADRERQQAKRIVALQSDLATSQRALSAANAQLREMLTNAPTTDARELGPTVLRYLDGVRAEQSGH